jgi:transposase
MPKKLSKKAKSQRSRERALLEKVHLNAAGIDVGANTHWVAVPEDRDENAVRSFGVFTSDLKALCDWLRRCQIETIAMESTGVYWIPLFQMLEKNGFEVRLVNASHAKNVPGARLTSTTASGCKNSTPSGCCEARFVPKPTCAWCAATCACEIL